MTADFPNFFDDGVPPLAPRRADLRRAMRGDFAAFIACCFATVSPHQPYLTGWHIELIAAALQAVERGEILRLIVNLPPRSLKSLIVSVAWPAWLLGHDPTRKIIVASYSQSLADKHSLDCRMVMQSAWYRKLFPDTELSRDQNEKHKFTTTQCGMRLATSVRGTLTGEGGHILIADDVLNPLQAMNEGERQAVNAWFDHTFSTRLDDKKRGAMVLVMQRLHEADVTAHLLNKGGWTSVVLPAVAEHAQRHSVGGRRFSRRKGSLLHPEREGHAELARAKRELGSAHFAAQYQQNPLPSEGGMIKREWLRRF